MIKSQLTHKLGPIWKFSNGQKAPAINFCHGLGEKGTDINRVLTSGLPEVILQGLNIPFNVYADQDFNGWFREDTETPVTIDFINSQPDTIKDAIAMTGLSAGGDACLRYLKSGRGDVACYVIIAANANNYDEYVDQMLGKPVWMFAGETDNSVNTPRSMEAFVKAYDKKFPGKIKRTVMAGVGHSEALWNSVYANRFNKTVQGDPLLYAPFDESIYDWMLRQMTPPVTEKPGIYIDNIWNGYQSCEFEGHLIQYKN